MCATSVYNHSFAAVASSFTFTRITTSLRPNHFVPPASKFIAARKKIPAGAPSPREPLRSPGASNFLLASHPPGRQSQSPAESPKWTPSTPSHDTFLVFSVSFSSLHFRHIFAIYSEMDSILILHVEIVCFRCGRVCKMYSKYCKNWQLKAEPSCKRFALITFEKFSWLN